MFFSLTDRSKLRSILPVPKDFSVVPVLSFPLYMWSGKGKYTINLGDSLKLHCTHSLTHSIKKNVAVAKTDAEMGGLQFSY